MFVNAIKKISSVTFPLIISKRFFSGKVESGCATFILLNKEGWILTASHVVETHFQYQKSQNELSVYNEKIKSIQSDVNLNEKHKRKKINKIQTNPEWITHMSFWWGRDGIVFDKFMGNKLMDIAVVKLKDFNTEIVSNYPVFKNPSEEMPIGTFLCRLGYPFPTIPTRFDEPTGRFLIENMQVPKFPIEGMHTRICVFRDEKGKKAKFIETSSPGLGGQSGGPIFDVNGHIWGIQSRTLHFPLGFSPKVKRGDKEVEENQFLNVGIGAHVDGIIDFLKKNSIYFEMTGSSTD
jgi:hypothetical protein